MSQAAKRRRVTKQSADAKKLDFDRVSSAHVLSPAASPGAQTELVSLLEGMACLPAGDYGAQRAWLQAVVTKMLGDWDLFIADQPHSIIELEVYLHSDAHPDPYTHGDEGQFSCGAWYFHRAGKSFKAGSFKGLDLACGSRSNGVHAGLLLRAVEDAAGNIVEGPSLLVDHILKLNKKAYIADFVSGRTAAELLAASTAGLELRPTARQPRTPPRLWAGPRVGLVPRAESGPGQTHLEGGKPLAFCARAYRFSPSPKKLRKLRAGFVAVAHLDALAQGRVATASLEDMGFDPKKLAALTKDAEDGKREGRPQRFVDKKLGTQPDICKFVGACDHILRNVGL